MNETLLKNELTKLLFKVQELRSNVYDDDAFLDYDLKRVEDILEACLDEVYS